MDLQVLDVDNIEWKKVPKVLKRSDMDERSTEIRPFLKINSLEIHEIIKRKFDNCLITIHEFNIRISEDDPIIKKIKKIKPTSYQNGYLKLFFLHYGYGDNHYSVFKNGTRVDLNNESFDNCKVMSAIIKNNDDQSFEIESISFYL